MSLQTSRFAATTGGWKIALSLSANKMLTSAGALVSLELPKDEDMDCNHLVSPSEAAFCEHSCVSLGSCSRKETIRPPPSF